MQSTARFAAYRRLFATPEDGLVAWWYTGVTYVVLPGQPEIPVAQIAAIMTYRTETVAADVFRIHWSEIGVFTDPATGEAPARRTNPRTGLPVDPPGSFLEGPGLYTVAATPAGVRLELEQPGARVQSLQVEFEDSAERFGFVQRERKQRGYPLADGTLPAVESVAGLNALTELALYTTRSELAKPPGAELKVEGAYRFTLAGIPSWMGFGAHEGCTRTLGAITRTRPGERLNARAWQMLEERFPREIVEPPAARV